MSRPSLDEVWQLGFDAALEGRSKEMNPYRDGTPLAKTWDEGFDFRENQDAEL